MPHIFGSSESGLKKSHRNVILIQFLEVLIQLNKIGEKSLIFIPSKKPHEISVHVSWSTKLVGKGLHYFVHGRCEF